MKIRIRGNSLRLRLTRSEVTTLAESGEVTEATHFGPDHKLIYQLVAREGAPRMEAHFDGNRVAVVLPPSTARDWAQSDTISLVGAQPVGDGQFLNLLVEKDFTCLNPRAVWQEDQTDNFPNPNPNCGTSHAH